MIFRDRFNRILAILLVSVLVIYISGCNYSKVPEADIPVKLLRTEPERLSQIKPDTTITLYFQGVPIDFKSSTGDVIVKGNSVAFTVRKGDFIGGKPVVRVGWKVKGLPLRWHRLALEDDLQTLTWTSKPLPSKSTLWLDAIETDAVAPKKNMPAKLIRVDPPRDSLITDTDTITLYFDNRPKHFKVVNAPYYISKAILKDNTVEIFQTPKTVSKYRRFGGTSFWVKWTDGNQWLYYKHFVHSPED